MTVVQVTEQGSAMMTGGTGSWSLRKDGLTVRYARVAITQQLKRLMLDNLGYGLALAG